jgi:hypothetical protein
MKTLVDKTTGKPLSIGDTVTTFRGETGILQHIAYPHKPGSTGRVMVYINNTPHEFFPSVINAEWR